MAEGRFVAMVSVGAAARRTGLAGSAGQMRQVCASRGVPVVGGMVDLGAFDGGAREAQVDLGIVVVGSGVL